MKTLVLILLGLATSVKAEMGISVNDVITDSVTINNVALSSAMLAGNGATTQLLAASLIGSATTFTTLLENRKILEIYNPSATVSVFCGINLSSTSAAGDLSLSAPAYLTTSTGRQIPPKDKWSIGLASRNNDGRVFVPWCVNNSGSASLTISVLQGRSK